MSCSPAKESLEPRKRIAASNSQAKPIDGREDDKENSDCTTSRGPSIAGSQSSQQLLVGQISPQLPPNAHPRCSPQTPANRIPLAQLLGNTEDVFNRDDKDISPEDHISWEHKQTQRSAYSSSLRTTRSASKGNKRARSSSPASSSQTPRPPKVDDNGFGDLKPPSALLRAPHNEPVLDPWAPYTKEIGARVNQEGLALQPLAQLPPISPTTPPIIKSKGKDLQRSISCGMEWPTSKPKRRKPNHALAETKLRDIFAASKKDIMGQEKSKGSRISALVGKFYENSLQRAQEPCGPSSSSPHPEHVGLATYDEHSPQSPSKPPVRFTQPEHNSVAEPDIPSQNHESIQQQSPEQIEVQSPSSEFGDDESLLDAMEAAGQMFDLEVSTAVPSAGGEPGHNISPADPQVGLSDITNAQSTNAVDHPMPPVSPHQQSPVNNAAAESAATVPLPPADSDDEFADGFDCDQEMADLAAQFDTPALQLPPPPLVPMAESTGVNQESRPTQTASEHRETSDEYAYDDDDDELWNQIGDGTILLEQGNGVMVSNQKCSNKQAIKRYLVLEVSREQFLDSKARAQPQTMLSVKDEKTGLLKVIFLRQAWLESRCTEGSYVHLIGDFDRHGQCVVDDGNNMIILHPDHLISATVVADSFSCTRRAVLQDRIKATGAAEPPQVYGHLLHEIFGQALEANDWSAHSLKALIEKILENWIESLYEINHTMDAAVDYLMGKMPELQAWASIFVNADAHPRGEVRDRNGSLSNMNVKRLLAVEEHIWSPMFGLKGNIDATVQITLQEQGQAYSQTLAVPLEFKTGKKDNNEMHRAQTALYTLLLSDRYDINVTSGILYYLETSKTFRIQALRNEVRHMVIQRNELACYVRNKLELPPMIKKPFLCSNCYAQQSCFTYHKLVDGGTGETSGLGEKFEQAVSHLKPTHQTFFQKWDELLTKEERDAMKFRRELWTMLSDEREALGRCFGKVYLETSSSIERPGGSKINRYQYTFKKSMPKPGFTFAESQLSVGEPIVVSDEKGHFALANGYVVKVRPSRLTVAVDRKLNDSRKRCDGFDADSKQLFQGIMEVATHESTQPASSLGFEDPPTLYRVDKDEFSNGMATVRNNLIQLMEKKHEKTRGLIVDGVPPAFNSPSATSALSVSASQQDLNVDQVHAIEKVMSAKDYALVLGMPGTGKTTTIAHIIRALVSQGKSVLLTSYTHLAVDNILLKIKDDKIPILRLGAVAKVHPEVQEFVDLAAVPKKTIAELEESYTNSQVVATTCLGVNHGVFNQRLFDYCIVDEASQITLPTCLGPIRMATTFILVGDHFQLPPLVQNKEAQQGGLDVSLFKILSDNQPDSVVNLEHQYRMAEDIMLLANTLIYKGRLKCGTPAVASRILDLPNFEKGLADHHHSARSSSFIYTPNRCLQSSPTCWLRKSLQPISRALFLNTDTLGPQASDCVHAGSSRLTNPLEATITTQVVLALLSTGVPASQIGIITFYRSQLTLLHQTTALGHISGLEMYTADKFQGRDKEVVVVSCVRSNESANVGDLLRDWRRVNVAITRARSKLLIVGSRGTLAASGNETLSGLVGLMGDQGWVVDLPETAVEEHVFDEALASTAGNGMTQSPVKKAADIGKENRKWSAVPRKRAGADDPPGDPSPILTENPNKRNRKVPGGAFRQPLKKVNGSLAQAAKALTTSGVLRDIVHGV